MATTEKKAFKDRKQGEGRSTAELFSELRAGLRSLEVHMDKRRNRDKASRLLSDSWEAWRQIAERFAEIGPHFQERAPTMEEDDDEDREQSRDYVPMSELFPFEESESESHLVHALLGGAGDGERRRLVRELLEQMDEGAIAAIVDDYRSTYHCIEQVRAKHYRLFIDYAVKGARQLSDVTRNLLSVARRVRPASLKAFGVGQIDVSRKLGERRATTSAREKRIVEKPMRKNGTKGFLLLGGTKTSGHRGKCRKAQMGNTNRKDAHARRLAATREAAAATDDEFVTAPPAARSPRTIRKPATQA